MAVSAGYANFKLWYQLSPIVLVGGIAAGVPGGGLPIISLTQSQDFDLGILGSSGEIDLDAYFAQYEPAAGGTLEDYQFGKYPFANQSVAANAVVQQPLAVSLLMLCPVNGSYSFDDHQAIMTALQSSLAQHAALGGTYTVATPKFIYTNCLLARLSDISDGRTKQPQFLWQWDFERPLITLAQAQQAQNALLAKMSSGTQMLGQPSLSGGSPVVGQPYSLATPPTVPAAQSSPAAGAVGATGGLAGGSFPSP